MDRRKELVRRAYEETAAAFAAARRSAGAEAPWLERFMLALPAGVAVVDLGCGNGAPIAHTLAAAGFAVTGIDFSLEQVRRAIVHVPSARFVVADMATVELEAGGFGGVIAWDSVFHLPAEEHAGLFARVRSWLAPGGPFVVTLGGTGGEVYTEHLGAATYYSALDVETAVRTITAAGFLVQECVLDDPGDHGHLVVVAIASACPKPSPLHRIRAFYRRNSSCLPSTQQGPLRRRRGSFIPCPGEDEGKQRGCRPLLRTGAARPEREQSGPCCLGATLTYATAPRQRPAAAAQLWPGLHRVSSYRWRPGHSWFTP